MSFNYFRSKTRFLLHWKKIVALDIKQNVSFTSILCPYKIQKKFITSLHQLASFEDFSLSPKVIGATVI